MFHGGAGRAENWMRGQFNLTCEKGELGVFFTMAPTKPPGVQHLSFQRIEANARLARRQALRLE